MLGVFRALPDGSGRLVPVNKKDLREVAIPAGATADAKDGDLIAVEVSRRSRFGPPVARVQERLGSLASEKRGQPDRHPDARNPPYFSRDAMAEAQAARPATLGEGREDWRDIPLVTIDPVDAKDHDDAVFARPDPDPANRGGFIIDVAIADVAHYVRPGSALDREALARGNSVYFPDHVVPMLPERISNDLCSLRPGEDRAALAVRMVIGADGRKHAHTLSSRADALRRKARLPAGAGRNRRPAGRRDRAAARACDRAALCRLPGAQGRPRRTRPARSRSAGAQDPAQT